MPKKISKVFLYVEVHSEVGDSIAAGKRKAGLDAIRFEGKAFASVWLSHQQTGEQVGDSLEEEGMIRVFGPGLYEDAVAFSARLQQTLVHAGCTVTSDTVVDD